MTISVGVSILLTNLSLLHSVSGTADHEYAPKICAFLKSLDRSKASGPDRISARMLKATADAIAPSVTKLFNSSIRCCRPPSSWKISSVVPLPKVPLANSTADYRSISLLSILSKVLEHHFHSLIMEHLSTSSSLSNCQWEFQPGKSTVLALLDTTHNWLATTSGKRVKKLLLCFSTIKKPLILSHTRSPLLLKLHAIGLEPGIISWIHNYLAERRQFVVFMVLHLKPQQLATSGVPQGSILGPLLLFNLH